MTREPQDPLEKAVDRAWREGELAELRAENERLGSLCDGYAIAINIYAMAIRITASEGTYDEMVIRKAVGFELAELIVEAHAALEPKP